jgi:hypothetical protein
MRSFAVWLFLMSAAFAFAQTRAPYPIPVSGGAIGWAGLPGTFSGTKPTYKDHPDPMCAKSRTNSTVICTTGQDVTFWNATSGAQVGTANCPLPANCSLTAWISATLRNGPTEFRAMKPQEVKLLYDEYIDRFLFVSNCCYLSSETDQSRHPYMTLAVSPSGDPTASTWQAEYISPPPATGLPPAWGNGNLRAAYNSDGVMLAYEPLQGHYVGDAIVALPNSDITWSGNGKLQPVRNGNYYDSSGTYPPAPLWDMWPCMGRSTATGDFMCYVTMCPAGTIYCQSGQHRDVELAFFSLKFDGTATKATLGTVSTGLTYYGNGPKGDPAPAGQPGGQAIRMNEDHRTLFAAKSGNRVWVAVPTAAIAQGMHGINLVAVNLINPASPKMFSDCGPKNSSKCVYSVGGTGSSNRVGYEAFMGHPDVDLQGNPVLFYNGSDSTTTYVSAYGAYLPPGRKATSLKEQLLFPGTKIWPGGCNGQEMGGWGMWNSSARDAANPNNFLVSIEVAAGDGETPCQWHTRNLFVTLHVPIAITIAPPSAIVRVGETAAATFADCIYIDGAPNDPCINLAAGGSFSSDNSSVAAIDKASGELKALTPGVAHVTFTLNGVTSNQSMITVSRR